MSWQAYVDQSLVGTGNVDKAAIFSAAGDSVWATSPSFQISPAEMTSITTAYKDTADVKQVQSTGLHIAGEKYVVLKADDRSIYGKKVSEHLQDDNVTEVRKKSGILWGKDEELGWRGCALDQSLTWETQGREGVVIVKTQQAILVAHYPESVQPGSAANTVEQLGDYLIKVGY